MMKGTAMMTVIGTVTVNTISPTAPTATKTLHNILPRMRTQMLMMITPMLMTMSVSTKQTTQAIPTRKS